MTIRLIIIGLFLSLTSTAQDDNSNHQFKLNNYMAFKFGLTFPNGNLKTIGNHPFLGIQYGYSFNKFLIGLDFDFRLLKSQNKFDFNYKDSIYLTDRLGGNLYIGLRSTYQIANFNKSKVNILAGIGFDQLEPVKAKKYKDRFKSDGYILSYNFNLGFEYVYKLNSNFDLGLNLKYNIVDYSLKNKTNLTGDYLSTELIVKIL